VQLYRGAANAWRTPDSVIVDVDVRIATTTDHGGLLNLDEGTTAADGIYFGSDVTLYRSAANVLTTDDSLVVTLGLNVGVAAGTAGTGDIAIADDVLLADGAIVGITGNETIVFAAAGYVNVMGADVGVGIALPLGKIHASDSGGGVITRIIADQSDPSEETRFSFYSGASELAYIGHDDATNDITIYNANVAAASNIELSLSAGASVHVFAGDGTVGLVGNVGIGTLTPNLWGWAANNRVLEIRGQAQDTAGQITLIATDLTAANIGGSIAFTNLDGGAGIVSRALVKGYRDGADDAMGLKFDVEATGAAYSTVMTITSAGKVGIGTETVPHGGVGAAKFAIEGTNSSAAGPHIQLTTALDDYPLVQFLAHTHDGIHLVYDAYWNGAGFKSSDAGSNFAIVKTTDHLRMRYESGVNPGDAVGWTDGLVMSASGQVGIGTTTPSGAKLHIDQAIVDAAIPVLILDQADISEGTINFIASDRGVITGATNSLESVRVEIGGVVRRLALYVDA